jgi:putative ATP-dependent endonuclease of OLD family
VEIRQLRIQNFRGFVNVVWHPHAGINCLIGPGDSGKSTVLDAIALLLAPRRPSVTEYDYRGRRAEDGFLIEAVLGDVRDLLAALGTPCVQGWRGGAVVPIPEGDDEPVLVVRVVGTEDIEVDHQIVRADDSTEMFRNASRAALGLIRVDTSTRAAAELRLVRGSLLSQRVGQASVRNELAAQLAALSEHLDLPEDTAAAVAAIADAFQAVGLTRDVALGLLAEASGSIIGMLALHAAWNEGVWLPFSSSGAGSRQTALFALASALPGDDRTIVVDEPETGLEPYRQRDRVARLRDLVTGHGQVFMTTHAPAVVASLRAGELWRIAGHQAPIDVSPPALAALIKNDGEALLSRLPLICEGETEQGILDVVLPALAQAGGHASPWGGGVHLVDGGGNSSAVRLAMDLCAMDIDCGLLVDDEITDRGRRAQVLADARCAGVAWDNGENLEAVVAREVPLNRLDDLVAASALLGARLNTRLEDLGEALGHRQRLTAADQVQQHSETAVRQALSRAMHECGWFKTRAGGRQLGTFLLDCGLPGEVGVKLKELWTRVSLHL